MKMMFFTLLQAEAAAPKGGGNLSFLLMLAVIFVIMWLFMIRPQQKRQKELNKFREGLSKGDKVVTAGGIYGKVVSVEGSKVLLEIDENVKIKVDKASLVRDFSETQQG